MAELKRTLSFSTFADSGPTTPWGPANSVPAFPSGYTQGGSPSRIANPPGAFRNFSSAASVNIAIIDDTALVNNIIAAEGYFSTVGTSACGFLLVTPAGTGYMVLVNSTNIRVFTITAWVLGSQVGSSIAFAVTSNHYGRFQRNNTSGVMEFFSGVNPSSLVSRGTVTQANANTNWRAGVFVRDNAVMASLVSAYTPSQMVDSFNGANDIQVGQDAVPFTSTGFPSGQITAITSAVAGVTGTNIVLSGLNDGAGTVDVSGFVEGGQYPKLPAVVEWTFANGATTAKITKNLVIPTGYSQVAYVNAIAVSNRMFSWHLQQAGISIADDTRVIWPTTAGFAFLSNGDTTSDILRTVNAWVRDVATGLMSEWEVTINDAGVVSIISIGASGVVKIDDGTLSYLNPIVTANMDDLVSILLETEGAGSYFATNVNAPGGSGTFIAKLWVNAQIAPYLGPIVATASDGTEQASIDCILEIPDGYLTETFSGILATTTQYLQFWLNSIGQPLQEGERVYWKYENALNIDDDSFVTALNPMTAVFFIHRNDFYINVYTLTLEEGGNITGIVTIGKKTIDMIPARMIIPTMITIDMVTPKFLEN